MQYSIMSFPGTSLLYYCKGGAFQPSFYADRSLAALPLLSGKRVLFCNMQRAFGPVSPLHGLGCTEARDCEGIFMFLINGGRGTTRDLWAGGARSKHPKEQKDRRSIYLETSP